MKDSRWIGRLIEFREPITLYESRINGTGAIVFMGKIKDVYRENGELFAEAETISQRSLNIESFDTNPDPNWTHEQYCRRRHHRTVYYVPRSSYLRNGYSYRNTKDRQTYLLKFSKNKWKSIKKNVVVRHYQRDEYSYDNYAEQLSVTEKYAEQLSVTEKIINKLIDLFR